jgi:DNA polymerase
VTVLYLDLETRSTVDLRESSVYRYVDDPLFGILMAAWAVDDGPVNVALGEREVDEIPGLWDSSVEKVAHNAPFERICLNQLGTETTIAEWTDTQMWAAEAGYPQGLDRAARALGLEQKDSAGTRLINMFCKPPFMRPSQKPEAWQQFIDYCVQDVVVLRELHRALPRPTDEEIRHYRTDQVINDRGIRVDVPLARRARSAAAANQATQTLEVRRITGVDNPNSNPQLLAWFAGALPNLQKGTVEKALERSDLTPEQRRVLELRQELALVASKKYTAALAAVNGDGRLRGQFRFFGAHTGRWAGRGVQMHNLPREALDNDADVALAIDDLMAGRGADALTLKALVRPMFLGPLVVSDYSAIEARVLAWLAGEEWVLQAFRDGRDIYVETAQRMGGLTRSQGKIAVLALGYNGALGSLRAMGGKGDDDELLALVRQWRKANSKIVNYWKRLDDAFRDGGPVRQVRVHRDGPDRHIELPSGRSLRYHNVKSTGGRLSFVSPSGARVQTYGGSLTENVTQAVARDLLAHALSEMTDAGLEVVGHVHDEVLVAGTDLERVTELMTAAPAWAHGLPLAAEGFVTNRYKKGA